jgi:hypothetical protein
VVTRFASRRKRRAAILRGVGEPCAPFLCSVCVVKEAQSRAICSAQSRRDEPGLRSRTLSLNIGLSQADNLVPCVRRLNFLRVLKSGPVLLFACGPKETTASM